MSAIVHAKDVTLPTFSVTKESVKGAALEYKFAGGVSWDDVRITWYDTKLLLGPIRKWRQLVWNQQKGLGPANKYKRQSVITQYLPDERPVGDPGVREYKLIGSWPSVIKYGELTYTSSDIKIVEVTLTYDWLDEIGQAGGAGGSGGSDPDNIAWDQSSINQGMQTIGNTA